MRYLVMSTSPVNSCEEAQFEELRDAKAWADSKVEGCTPLDYNDTDCDCRNSNYWYEVYDTAKKTDEDDPIGECVYQTKRVYY